MNEQLVNRIRQCPSLPSLPAIALEVLELTQTELADLPEIARVISKDAALASRILRTVNSSFYGRSQSISSVSTALVMLGLQAVKTLVLGFSLVSSLTASKAKGFKHLVYWRRSVYSATAARTLAARLELVQQEEPFLAALLSDIGMLVLDQVLGAEYGEIHEVVTTHHELAAAELTVLGMTHAEVGGVVAELWKLPPLLRTPIAHHHAPDEVADEGLRRIAEVVHLAGYCADVFVDANAAGAIAYVRGFCRDRYQMGEAACDALLNDIGNKTKEVAPLFEISIGSGANYDEILRKANEVLVDLTLRTQQQAASLQAQNQRLQAQATTDGLTGLANRAALDAFVAEQFAAARTHGRPLSLILMDVDKFKSINDRHGHPAGDAVLVSIAKLLKSAARAQDLAARYGGEELCLVLPATTRQTAAAIAESIRRTICARPVAAELIGLNVTASIGVAAYEPPSVMATPAHLLKAADLSMYAAKQGGRNCVRVFNLAAPAAA